MNRIKFYAQERHSSEGGGYSYLKNFIQFFEGENISIDFHEFSLMNSSKILIFLRLIKDLKYDWIIFKSNYIPTLTLNFNSILIVDFPFQKKLSYLDKIKLNRVKYIICNSEYTAKYIHEYWGRKACIIYPPCMDTFGQIENKQKIILNVGRFNNSNRSKNQDKLIEAFKKIYDSGIKDYKLILAGFVQDENYVAHLKVLSSGYPVIFYQDVDTEELTELYGRSTFYWHGCGYGNDVELFPSLTEHYGISVADAMSAGCVTLVHNSGGPVNLIQNAVNGFVWNTLDELVSNTTFLINNTTIIKQFSIKAKQRSFDFTKYAFNIKLLELLGLNKQ
jgi:glycosyltransferase involved in cell wall biosynthesis